MLLGIMVAQVQQTHSLGMGGRGAQVCGMRPFVLDEMQKSRQQRRLSSLVALLGGSAHPLQGIIWG